MEKFIIETEAEIRGRGNIIYALTSVKKIIVGCGMVRVYGVRCYYTAYPETERCIEDISSSRERAIDVITKLAKYKVAPGELEISVESLLG